MTRQTRIDDATARKQLALVLATRYLAGGTLDGLVEASGLSKHMVRALLKEREAATGTVILRKPGRSRWIPTQHPGHLCGRCGADLPTDQHD